MRFNNHKNDYKFMKHSDELTGRNEIYVKNEGPYVNTTFQLNELGVGISQVFPFVVGVLASKGGIFSCEQPELHIHPKWQLDLGDMMLETINHNPEKMFLIETHSEHLMLRLLKRRRETAESDLQDEDFACTAEDVQIIFCEQENGQTRLMPIATTDASGSV